MQANILDRLAQVLSTENLTVVRDKAAATARFDLNARVLTLPVWEGLGEVVEKMLVQHEVAHAIFTPTSYSTVCEEIPGIAEALNIVEDARIERLYKLRYPGSREDFIAAAKNFQETDFFEVEDRVDSLNLLDRVNLFFKMGKFTNVKFSAAEAAIVARIQLAETFEEVVDLAKGLMAAAQEEQLQKEQDFELLDGDGDDGNDGSSKSQEYFDAPSASKPTEASASQESQVKSETPNASSADPKVKSETAKTMDSKLTRHKSIGKVETDVLQSYKQSKAAQQVAFVPYKKLLAEFMDYVSHNDAKQASDALATSAAYRARVKPQVQHMVAQFELRKAADAYAGRIHRKVGKIDTNKIASYRVKDDVFTRSIIEPKGQNHGMVMLLDWSGSMRGDPIKFCRRQVIQQAMFCRQVGVPFRVIAFWTSSNSSYNKPEIKLLELLSDTMSLQEFNLMVGYMLDGTSGRVYPLGRTPLDHALYAMQENLPAFKQQYRLDKTILMVLTDGICSEIVEGIGTHSFGKYSSYRDLYISYGNKTYHADLANAPYVPKNAKVTNLFYRMLRDNIGVEIITFFVSRKTAASHAETGLYDSGVLAKSPIGAKELQQWRADGFVESSGYGRKKIYVVKADTLSDETDVGLGDLGGDETAAATARKLSKTLKNRRGARLLTEALIAAIS